LIKDLAWMIIEIRTNINKNKSRQTKEQI